MLDRLKHGTDSIRELLTIYAVSAIIVTILFSLVEHHNLFDSFYWTYITGLTIGYGDISPVSVAGKLLAFIWSHFMVFFLIPLFAVRILKVAIEDRNEFTDEEQQEIKRTNERLNAFLDRQEPTTIDGGKVILTRHKTKG